MLVTSIFSFYLNVFKSLLFYGHLKLGLCGKEVTFMNTAMSRLRAFNITIHYVTQTMEFAIDRLKNIVEKGENTDFLLFPHGFKKGYFIRVVKTRGCVVKK